MGGGWEEQTGERGAGCGEPGWEGGVAGREEGQQGQAGVGRAKAGGRGGASGAGRAAEGGQWWRAQQAGRAVDAVTERALRLKKRGFHWSVVTPHQDQDRLG